ncbi:hypothetical protein OBG91_11710 [Lactococcus lactis]|nr:hypothetical protein [Lactococcus lactis]
MVDTVKELFRTRSKSFIIEFFNSLTINNATNVVIVGNETTLKDIERLEKIPSKLS